MNIKLQQYLYHSILGFLLVIGSSPTFAAADVEQYVINDGECFDYPDATHPHAVCWKERSIVSEIKTPSGNTIYQMNGEVTDTYHHLTIISPDKYVMEQEPYDISINKHVLRTVKKAGDTGDHVFIDILTSGTCNHGNTRITTIERRFIGGDVIRDKTEYESLSCAED